jgi:hypothetical protein
MLDYEARDAARRIIQARLIARSEEFRVAIRDIRKGIPMCRPVAAYGVKVRALCVSELESRGTLIWEELQRVLSTLVGEGVPSPGEYRTWGTFAANLKLIVAYHLDPLPIRFAQVMQEFEDRDTSILFAVRDRTLHTIDAEIDLYVCSLQHRAEAGEKQTHMPGVLIMTNNFDQRSQRVTNQYNAGGNITFGVVQNRMDIIGELEKLQTEMTKAKETGFLDEDVATDADYQLTKAVQQAKKPEPEKKTILEHLSSAKALIEGVSAASGLVSALTKAVEVVQHFF